MDSNEKENVSMAEVIGTRFHKELALRFVKDNDLPISLIEEKTFDYFLNLYDATHSSMKMWVYLWREIDERFGGDANKYLENFYNVRENIVQHLSNSDSNKKLNAADMSQFKISCDIPSKNIFNCENIGKHFVSIDLKKANFQAVKFFDASVFMGHDTYEDFIGEFTDLQSIKSSKHVRQVIFGQLNPSRHITIEKYLTDKIRQLLLNDSILSEGDKIVSLHNDELIIELASEPTEETENKWMSFSDTVASVLRLLVKVSVFKLNAYRLVSKQTNNPRDAFFELVSSNGCKKYKMIPSTFSAITYKLLNKEELKEPDLLFFYEGVKCKFFETFRLENVTKEMLLELLKKKFEKKK